MICFWCNRPLKDEDIGRRVIVGFSTRWMCENCWSHSEPEVPLDYTERRDDFDYESQPEFNGAFRDG